MFRTIISPDSLKQHLGDPDWVVIDCRFSLDDPGQGWREYQESHIPGALYAHLDRDLSGEIVPGETGRHPLPEPQEFVDMLSSWGIDHRVQVVAYDARGGAIAARLWWMLRWMGHDQAAVLEGGWPAWQRAGYEVNEEVSSRKERQFKAELRPELFVEVDFVNRIRENDAYLLVDARDGERYRGEEEPIDPVAGHIPGAVSAPYVENLTQEERFRSSGELRSKYERILAGRSPEQVVFYCGSGVTSAHHLIAMVHAGYELPRLYPGSWSEWITDPDRPVA